MKIPKYWFVTIALALSVGPNLLIMSGFMQIQSIIQNSLTSSSYSTMWISIVANVSFAVFIPLGPIIGRRLGPRFSFCIAAILSALTYVLSTFSPNLWLLGVSRGVEGALTGTQLMVLVPLLFISYPAERRNRVLGILLSVMFGSVCLGAIFGSISQEQDDWRWLFALCAILSLLALFVRRSVPVQMVTPMSNSQGEQSREDILGTVLLFMLGMATVIALGNILPSGLTSPLVYLPAFIAVLLLFALFFLELQIENPILNFRLLKSKRSIFGAIMAIGSNLLMLVAMSGLGFGIRLVGKIPTSALPSVYWGLVISVAIASVLAAALFDRIGAAPLFMLGSACITGASYRLMVLGAGVSIDSLRMLLVLFACGVGLNFVVGLVTCALGGPLNQLPRTMTVVQFLRVLFYSTIAPVMQWFLNEATAAHFASDAWGVAGSDPTTFLQLNRMVQHFVSMGQPKAAATALAASTLSSRLQTQAALTSTHRAFFIAFAASVCLFVLACIFLGMGKGPSMSTRGNR